MHFRRRSLPLRTSIALLALTVPVLAPAGAGAVTTMTLVGTTATITGDAAAEVVVVEDVGGVLQHNRATDPGYASATDFDTSVPGDQTVPASAASNLVLQLGAGPNTLVLKDNSAVAQTWAVGAASVVSPLATVAYDTNLSGLTLQGGTASDTFSVLATAAGTPVTLETGTSGDTVSIGSAAGTLASIAGAVRSSGGASNDAVTINDSVSTTGLEYALDQEPGRTTLSRTPAAGVISWDASVATATLRAGAGNDRVKLVAPPASATVFNVDLGRGNDVLYAQGTTNLGGGTLTGGDGDDFFDLSNQTAGVNVDMAAGVAGVFGPATGIERVLGSASGDTLRGTGADDVIEGGPGDDVLGGAGGNDLLLGGPGNDQLDGGDGDDDLRGAGGNDAISGGGGNDLLGGDTLGDDESSSAPKPAADTLDGGDGDDQLGALWGGDTFVGGAGIDAQDNTGTAGALTISLDGVANDGQATDRANVGGDIERVVGGLGSDTFTGNAAANTFVGGQGNDTFVSGAAPDGADAFDGGSGTDTMSYERRKAAVTVTLDAKANDGAKKEGDLVGAENVLGGSGADVLVGNAQANRLVGNAGKDRITGGLGKDVLEGGAGNDTLLAKDRVKDVLDGGIGVDAVVRDLIDVAKRVP